MSVRPLKAENPDTRESAGEAGGAPAPAAGSRLVMMGSAREEYICDAAGGADGSPWQGRPQPAGSMLAGPAAMDDGGRKCWGESVTK